MIPAKRITDASFKYVNAANTDIGKTFARIRKQQREAREAEARSKVTTITRKAVLS